MSPLQLQIDQKLQASRGLCPLRGCALCAVCSQVDHGAEGLGAALAAYCAHLRQVILHGERRCCKISCLKQPSVL
jgi:hypothetical protein